MLSMKILKAFRLSEEAIKVLDEQRHATEFLEDLILGYAEKKMEVVPLHQLQTLLDAEFAKLGSLPKPEPVSERYARQGNPVNGEPKVVELGYACCKLKTPCKHWSYANELWTNSLTGEIKEVNA